MSGSSKTDMRTPLAKVRGHGSAKDGTSHFWEQRLTALANIPLSLFFMYAVFSMAGKSYNEAMSFIGHPFVAIMLLLFVVSSTYHMKLGMQMVIEDYVSDEKKKILFLILNIFFSAAIGFACIFSILNISFGG
ncbi:MAG: succinate dehydrogenase, hydrophobic membrane anchor protein [Hyphomicrobiales bacterium]